MMSGAVTPSRTRGESQAGICRQPEQEQNHAVFTNEFNKRGFAWNEKILSLQTRVAGISLLAGRIFE